MSERRAAIFGCSGETLTPEEARFFEEVAPWGFILFARNCRSPDQIKGLCDALRATVGDPYAPILIDQEGGRVARLKPPQWPERPPMDRFGALLKLDPTAAKEAARLGARLLAQDLAGLGINVNCIPVLDVPQPDAHDIIGDRALATAPDQIAMLGAEVISGSIAGGVLPIIKHIPGHGRALVDSHLELPAVVAGREDLSSTDFAPFKALNNAPMAMTAHVIYKTIDTEKPATLSSVIIEEVIRGEIGFDGLLMTDDLSMKALEGGFADRTRQSLEAGCDVVLHCNGEMAEMLAVAEALPPLKGTAKRRADAAMALLSTPDEFDPSLGEARFAQLLKPVMV